MCFAIKILIGVTCFVYVPDSLRMFYWTFVHNERISWSWSHSLCTFVNPLRHRVSLVLCDSFIVGWDCFSVEMLTHPPDDRWMVWSISEMVTKKENEICETSVTSSTTSTCALPRDWSQNFVGGSWRLTPWVLKGQSTLFNVRDCAFSPRNTGLYDCHIEPRIFPQRH